VKLSGPLKPAAGVYVKLPSVFSVSAPWLGPVTTTAVRLLPSTSVSFASTPGAVIVSAVSSFVAKLSLTATGASFTGLIVSATVATLESACPSLAL